MLSSLECSSLSMICNVIRSRPNKRVRADTRVTSSKVEMGLLCLGTTIRIRSRTSSDRGCTDYILILHSRIIDKFNMFMDNPNKQGYHCTFPEGSL